MSNGHALRFDLQKFLLLATLIILSYLVIPPVFVTIYSSLRVTSDLGSASLSIGNYVDILASPGTAKVLLNSLVFAAGSSLLSIVFGTLLAWLVENDI